MKSTPYDVGKDNLQLQGMEPKVGDNIRIEYRCDWTGEKKTYYYKLIGVSKHE